MTVPSTDSERAPALGATPPVGTPQRLPRRVAALPVRQRNRVALDTLEETLVGLQQIDDHARPAAPAGPGKPKLVGSKAGPRLEDIPDEPG